MPGMLLGGQGGVRAMAGGFSNTPAPATATQAAFGTASTGYPSTMNSLSPNDPFGVALWAAVIAAGLLVVIRHSLPA